MTSTEIRKFIGTIVRNYMKGIESKAQCYYDLESINWDDIEETDGITAEDLKIAADGAYQIMDKCRVNQHK